MVRSLTWFVISLAVGCGGAAVPDAGADPDAGVGMDSGTARDASIATDAGDPSVDAGSDAGVIDDAGAPDAGDALRVSMLSFGQRRRADAPAHMVLGAFYPELVAGPELEGGYAPRCAPTSSAGACIAYNCALPPTTSRVPGELTIEVEGTEIATVAPISDVYLAFVEGIVAEPGDTVSFRLGSELGGSSLSGMVTTPGVPTATFPSTAPRDAPLTLTWSTSAPADRVQVRISVLGADVICMEDGATGSVTIAPELLALLPPGRANVELSTLNKTLTTFGSYRVLFSVFDVIGASVTFE